MCSGKRVEGGSNFRTAGAGVNLCGSAAIGHTSPSGWWVTPTPTDRRPSGGRTNHENDQLIVLNFVYHAVAADTDSPEAAQAALQHTARARMFPKAVDGVNDARAVR